MNKLADYIENYNLWRRGSELHEMPEPKELGEMLYKAVTLLKWHLMTSQPEDGSDCIIKTNFDRMVLGRWFKANEGFTLHYDIEFWEDEHPVAWKPLT